MGAERKGECVAAIYDIKIQVNVIVSQYHIMCDLFTRVE